ncbi:hypothetical protein KVR01_002651 [Diaporthe batatas]|uniref:uncharacterized protein n=1 Tax=Diaporthe batatas TaxID=748121 RepID=UPI001D0427BF|nr:uncharacterized protein KVR01_002651 [Diaporthe batatas]KAG8166962.1 hypothetical protein KVR01_002651 [Diaporthe batatas]
MEYRDETAPRRRRTKRRGETRERDFTWSGTNKRAAGHRRIRRDDDKTDVEDEAVDSSDDESDDEDTSPAAPQPTSLPGMNTPLPQPPPPPPIATSPSATLDSQTPPPASLGTQTLESSTVSTTSQPATNTPVAASETIDPPRTQNEASLSRQSGGMPPAATAALAVLVSLGGVCLVAFLFWKLYRRRRGRDEPDQSSEKDFYYGSGPKSDIRVMDEAMAAVYKAEGGYGASAPSTRYSASILPDKGVSRWSDSTPGWLRRQVQKVKAATSHGAAGTAAGDEPSPKDAAVSGWMDRHTSRMLDPMVARASIASSGVASLRGLGPVPSVSPASVVGDPRESILSEMGQIRRAAVPPPLDPKMVERVRQMQGQNQMREQEQARGPVADDVEQGALRPPPPMADRWGNSSPMSPAQTETTWNTWGVEQRRK